MGNSYFRIPALWEQGARRLVAQSSSSALDSSVGAGSTFLQEETFHSMLAFERRRAERSRKPFVLMVLEPRETSNNDTTGRLMSRLIAVLLKSTRETDLVGWYKEDGVLGVIFTEINFDSATPITEILRTKVYAALQKEFDSNVAASFLLTVHLFPETRGSNDDETSADLKLYADLTKGNSVKTLPRVLKRIIDIAGSGFLLILAAPFLAVIAVIIKLTSKGPVLFRQERVGQLGARFKCLKFRTMFVNNDPKIHQEFVQKFIAGQNENPSDKSGKTSVFKITNDPRVTAIGRFLRKTSLDEFPQFWNVLRGEMSLVGPRPPVPYEFQVYDTWHRRRVLEVKPGVTGLWQVSGRSRTTFDEMVRLDVRYSQTWSLALDMKILLATPRAVLGGEGAY